jgi:hypothetical protein
MASRPPGSSRRAGQESQADQNHSRGRQLVLKDKSMEVVVYRAINNSHMANGVFVYAPARVVAEGDLVDEKLDMCGGATATPTA